MNQRIEPPTIPFIDLAAQRRRLGAALDQSVSRVLDHGQFILGPEVRALETELASFCGVKHVVTCASGTDALILPLRARGIGPGDAVICPSFTFCATAEVAVLVGATPIFVDVDPKTFNMDVNGIIGGVKAAKQAGLVPKAIIPVDLFGLPVDHMAVATVAEENDLFVLDDAAQGFGGMIHNRRIGSFGHATSTSFFPAKPLGCYGDGGAVMTDDRELAETMFSLRVHGQGVDKYDNVRIGGTSRLDTIQAAVLLEKLKIFPEEIEARNAVAQRYLEGLADLCVVPGVPNGVVCVWAQYTIRVPAGQRNGLAAALKAEGIPTAIYYPIPLHQQQAYKHYPIGESGVTVSEALAAEVISLPMHPYLDAATQDRIIATTRRFLQQ